MIDYRDLVIAELAENEAALQERVVSLTADVDAYRLMAQRAIHALAEVTNEYERLRTQHHRLAEEYRYYRTATIGAPGRAA